MRPRTNWDTRETPGVQAYRERRRRRLERMGEGARQPGRTLRDDRPGTVREELVHSPEQQAEQQDYAFEDSADLIEHELAVKRGGGVRQSREVKFTTEDAANALTEHEKKRRRRE